MRKIYTIKKYDVEYGNTFHFEPLILARIICDSGSECQTFGDADFDETGLYEFDKELFAELVNWTAAQSEDYFVQFMPYLDTNNFKHEVLNLLQEMLDANKSNDSVVRFEIY